MTVASILRQKGADIATISPDADAKSAADWLHAKNIGALLVISDDAILGIISERDIVHAFSRYGAAVASLPVKNMLCLAAEAELLAEIGDRVWNQTLDGRVAPGRR